MPFGSGFGGYSAGSGPQPGGGAQGFENFNFGGMSGGPLIAIVQAEIMRTWKPAGVIISGPNPGDARHP